MFAPFLTVMISNDSLVTAFLVVWIVVGLLWILGWLLGRVGRPNA